MQSTPLAPPEEQTPVQKSRAAIEAIEPSKETRAMPRVVAFDWVLPDGREVRKEYVQAELGLFPAEEFGTRITEIIESFTKGDMGVKIGDLFRGQLQMPTSITGDAVNSLVEENVALITAFVKLVQTVPELQLDIYCLSLGVPRLERPWAKEQMQEPPHRGGLTVNQGFELLSVFISQNADLLKETFVGNAKALVEQFQLEIMGIEPDIQGEETSSPSTSEKTAAPLPETPAVVEAATASTGTTPSSTSSPLTPESV